MEALTLDLPSMYADHHVLAVREALASISGVEDVVASSARKQVSLSYDPGKVKPEAIQSKLEEAGYGVNDELTYPIPPQGKEDSSTWFCVTDRVTVTHEADLEMSGDHRNY
jgi:copper chaperone CopZ